jgi:hypothetical protein
MSSQHGPFGNLNVTDNKDTDNVCHNPKAIDMAEPNLREKQIGNKI